MSSFFRLFFAALCVWVPCLPLNVHAQTSASPPPAGPAVQHLNREAPLEREIKGGETQRFLIPLKTNEYLNGVVEHNTLDLTVRILAPDGTTLSENTTPTRKEIEPGIYFLLVADQSGDFSLEITSRNDKAPPGSFLLRVLEWRAALADETTRLPAQMWFEEGLRLQSKPSKENYLKAIAFYQKSKTAWEKAGDTGGVIQALAMTGLLYYGLGDKRKSYEHAESALRLIQSSGIRDQELVVTNNLATVSIELGEPLRALEYFGRAKSLLHQEKDKETDGYLTLNMGYAYWSMGELQKTLEAYHQAIRLFQETKNRTLEAVARNNLGILYRDLGDFRLAFGQLEQALKMERETGDRRSEGLTISNFGSVYRSRDELPRALEYFQQALPIFQEVGDRHAETNTLTNLGKMQILLKQPRQALEFFKQALPLSQTLGVPLIEAEIQLGLGLATSDLGDDTQALALMEKSLALRRSGKNPVGQAQTLLWIAKTQRKMGHLNEAKETIQEAIRLVEELRSRVANQEFRASYVATIQGYYEFYLDLLLELHRQQPTAGFDRQALQVSERARARSLLEMLAQNKTDLRQGVAPQLLEQERELQGRLSAKLELLAKLLAGRHTAEQEAAAKTEIDTLNQEYQQIQAEIQQKSPRYAALTQPQPLSTDEIQKQVLDPDTLLLEYALGEERSFLFVVSSQTLKVYELPKRKDIETLAEHLYQSLKRSEAQESEGSVGKSASPGKPAGHNEIDRFSTMILGPVAAELGRKRLLIVPDGALHYIPFSALTEPAIQGSGLRVEGSGSKTQPPLLFNHELVTLPSASALAVLRKETAGRKPAAKMLAILADPVFGGTDDERVAQLAAHSAPAAGDRTTNRVLNRMFEREEEQNPAVAPGATVTTLRIPRLPGTRLEANSIAQLAPPKQTLKALGFEVNRSLISSPALSQYRYLHFATHGYLDTERPELSALLLSMMDQKGKPQDGFFRSLEVYNLQLPAELVTLSACETGLGKSIKGEGLVGLTRGFMYAGTKRIIVSLWAVNDAATAELMKRFYRKLLTGKERPAAALRAAQLEMVRDTKWKSPYYWAPFVLQGEFR